MHTITLRESRPDGLGQVRLRFDRDVADHTAPGQFVTLHVPGHKPAFFAIASLPGEPVELLIKAEGDAAHDLAGMAPGAEVEVSEAMGAGFGLDAPDTRPLVLLAGGSGISALRPVLEAELARGLPRPVTLLYGVRTPAHAAFAERWEAWLEAGVDARLVLSRPEADWTGERGHVQDVAARLGLITREHIVAVCGVREMQDDAKFRWRAAGASADQVRTNW